MVHGRGLANQWMPEARLREFCQGGPAETYKIDNNLQVPTSARRLSSSYHRAIGGTAERGWDDRTSMSGLSLVTRMGSFLSMQERIIHQDQSAVLLPFTPATKPSAAWF